MEKNVGRIDQIVRYAIAVVLTILAIVFTTWWLLIPAVLLAVTSFVGRCGLYKLFGINTCKLKQK